MKNVCAILTQCINGSSTLVQIEDEKPVSQHDP
jgi:hypothetical protein